MKIAGRRWPAPSGRPRRRPAGTAGTAVMVVSAAVLLATGMLAGSALASGPAIAGAGAAGTYTGALPDGATYQMQIPPHWNGILFLYSHGYVIPGSLNPAADTGDILTGAWLVDHGYAVAGSSYASTGWAVQQALDDQMSTLERFEALAGRRPDTVVAWGHSLGGLVTLALAERFPDRIDGAVALCGVAAGAGPLWDVDLAAMSAFRTLLAPKSGLRITGTADPEHNLAVARSAVEAAQKTAAGRARLALVSAIAGIPGWYMPGSAAPSSPDGQETAQFQWWDVNDLPFFADLRAELQHRAGGNFSTDAGFNYARALSSSPYAAEVKALYASAHLRLAPDLARLAHAPVVLSKPSAASYVRRYADVNGDLAVPVLTMHTTGDGLVPDDNEAALAAAAAASGRSSMLRQLSVARAGHCTFTASETVAGIEVLLHRLSSGTWEATDPKAMNALAQTVGSRFDQFTSIGGTVDTKPAFTAFDPPRFPLDAGAPR